MPITLQREISEKTIVLEENTHEQNKINDEIPKVDYSHYGIP
jgi:hypothetical protein